MKTIRLTALAALCVIGSVCSMPAATFTSGSDGSYGPLNVTTNTTLQIPPDGIFNCTTINVASVATLSFRPNAFNTPVYLLATSNITISGTINVSGQAGAQGLPGVGGPGGFDGGPPAASSGDVPGDGHGPGAGKAGNFGSASYGTGGGNPGGSINIGLVYGSPFLQPLVGGSGGGGSFGNPGSGGGGGGGAILLASTTGINMSGGTLRASGGFPGGGAGGGSGGAIRIVAPTFQGNGQIDTTGGILNVNYYGGTGRIRVDVLDRNGWNFTFYGKFSAGSKMVVFPPTIPRLDILEAAGQSIPFGTNSFVSIDLPRTAPTNQTVRVRATDFTGVVPISVVVVPDSGPSRSFPASIDMSGGNPSETNITVILTPGALNRIYSWTR